MKKNAQWIKSLSNNIWNGMSGICGNRNETTHQDDRKKWRKKNEYQIHFIPFSSWMLFICFVKGNTEQPHHWHIHLYTDKRKMELLIERMTSKFTFGFAFDCSEMSWTFKHSSDETKKNIVKFNLFITLRLYF